ncbi:endo-1,4-beta-xylanase [Gloeothece verrucosa]|uniref:Glycoside hydrolase family 10 n=1 Tax=Gloeothece verrucosa (strain PCC 7822) TaxID=497965 RepID=E0UIA1_GLOV7|nr:endo-1,4-beta-xylanase [Gloeothece verrucosa]ADN16869.1 glycoside hydrolase family 10 [Gloeothece verrucosa PCC 7822]
MVRINRRQVLHFLEGLTLATIAPHSGLSLKVMAIAAPEIEIRVWDTEGKPLDVKKLSQLYFLNLNDEPLPRLSWRVEEGKFFAQVPAFPFMIALKMPIRGFGEVTLYADNNGRGYSAADFPLNLNLAFAQSRLHRVTLAVSTWLEEGIQFPDFVSTRLERAKDYLNKALSTDIFDFQLSLYNKSLAESLWAGEKAVFAQAKYKIKQQATRLDFLFGCNFFRHSQDSSEYDKHFKALFNFATVPFYWRGFEPQPNQKNFAEVDEKVSWLMRSRITPKGHPLVWFHEAGIPDWVMNKSYEEIKELTAKRVTEIVAYYKQKIPYYDIINEPHGIAWANKLNYNLDQFIELTRIASDAAYQGNPQVIRIINNCNIWAENIPYHKPPQHSPYEYLKATMAANIPFEVIGLQLYYPDQDMFEINRMLDRFSQLGKPIHITELGVSSSTEPDENSFFPDTIGLWHEPWSQKVQADWLEQFYTLCYSKPYIKAISWWDLADGGNFWPHGGLLNADMTPKESFYRLRNLLYQWGIKQDPKKKRRNRNYL